LLRLLLRSLRLRFFRFSTDDDDARRLLLRFDDRLRLFSFLRRWPLLRLELRDDELLLLLDVLLRRLGLREGRGFLSRPPSPLRLRYRSPPPRFCERERLR
jgi:hypothetical protein